MPHLTSLTLLNAVESAIHEALIKQDCFNNPSLVFHGVDLDFNVRLTLYSRGEEQVIVNGHVQGDVPADATRAKVAIEGKHSIGKRSKNEGKTIPDYQPVTE